MVIFREIPKNVLLIAPFPPCQKTVARQSAALLHELVKAGLNVQTVSGILPAYCQHSLVFGPKKRFDPILAGIIAENHDLAVLYPQALGFDNAPPRKWKNRRVEEFRRLKFLFKIAFFKPKVVLAFPAPTISIAKVMCVLIIIAARALRPRSVRIVLKKGRGAVLAGKILNAPSSAPSAAFAEETVFSVAKQAGNILLTPAWMRHAVNDLSRNDPIYTELKSLQLVVNCLATRQTPFSHPITSHYSGAINDKILDQDNDVPLSEFMVHLHHKFKNDMRINLKNREGRLNYLRWYMLEAPRVLNYPLPLLPEIINQFRADCKLRASLIGVEALRQPDTKDIILPVYFLSLFRCYPKRYAGHQLETNDGRIALAFQIITEHSRFNMPEGFMGKSLQAYFSAPVGGLAGNLSRFELLAAVLSHAPGKTRECLSVPWKSAELASWFLALSNAGYPLLGAFSSITETKDDAIIHVTGTESRDTGLGRNQKMSTKALGEFKTNRPVFLHHVNADEIPAQMMRNNKTGAFHIGFLLWEMDELPKVHRLTNQLLDEIWVPSKFVQEIYSNAYDRQITMIGKGFDLPKVSASDRSFYGFDQKQTVFLLCFDMNSSVSRKNPLAAIRAFQNAFPNDNTVRFILKTTPPPSGHWGDSKGQMAKISRIASRDPRIVIDQRFLPFPDLMALINTANCIVSSHRAEGFGYFPAYALKYGKPVIATDYSGTQDFCNSQTAFPVAYKLRPVENSESIFPMQGALWAEIDQTALSQAMRDVADDLTGAQSRAAVGQALMHDFYSETALQNRYLLRLQELDLIDHGLARPSHNIPVLNGEIDPKAVDSARNVSPVAEP